MDVAVPYYSDEAGFSQRVSEKIILDVLDLKQMDILDVLKLMSKKSGLNIVAGQNVKGRISIYVEKMDVEDALEIIVDSYGWAYEREGNIVRVMTSQDYENKYGHKFGEDFETRVKQLSFANTADLLAVLNQVKSRSGRVVADDKSNTIILMDTPQKLDEMEMIISKIDVSKKTVIFDLSYGKAEDVANKISELLTPNVGVVKHDERSNKIAVSDTSVKLKDISQLVKAFDQQDKEVLIEAKILQILLNDEHKMGIDWEGIIHDFHDFHLKSDFGILSDSDKGGRLSVGTVDDDFIQNEFKLTHVVPVCSGYDYRQGDSTFVHQNMMRSVEKSGHQSAVSLNRKRRCQNGEDSQRKIHERVPGRGGEVGDGRGSFRAGGCSSSWFAEINDIQLAQVCPSRKAWRDRQAAAAVE